MIKAKILCDKCEKEYNIEIEEVSDLFGITCPKCNSDETWIMDIDAGITTNEDVVLGKGGCGQR